MKRYYGFLILLLLFSNVLAVRAQSPDPAQVTFTEIASGLTRPLNLTQMGDARLFVVEQDGLIKIIENGAVNPTPFLDVSSLISRGGNEQGLLGLAFHPGYVQNGWFFINYTDTAGDTVVARYNVSGDPNVADPNSAQTVLIVDQPYTNHNGGHLVFGPDGMLYIGLGDGGSGGDPQNRAQNGQTLLGKMLRINVDQLPYTVPGDNPFVGNSAYLPEIWALGLRNPWRYSFDRASGDQYIADVGQNVWEEVNFQPAGIGGQNYGWNVYEGNHPFSPGDIPGAIMPVAEYNHDLGCSVTGGYVYRGANIPGLQGAYLYGDFCSGRIWTTYRDAGGAWQTALFVETDYRISAFGEDAAGELYVVDHGGRVLRIDPVAAPAPTETTEAPPEPTDIPPTPTPLPDPTTPTLRVDVSAAEGTANAALNLFNMTNLYGLEITCVVDPAVLAGTGYTEGEFNSGNSYFIDQTFQPDGRWLVAMSRLHPNPAFSGNATAITLNYTVQGAGNSDILCAALAVDQDGRSLPIEVQNGFYAGAPEQTETVAPPEETPIPTEIPITSEPTIAFTETPFVPTLPPETPVFTETPVPTEATPEVTPEITVEPPVGTGTISGLAVYQNRLDAAGIRAELLGADEAVIAEVVTAADGAYQFASVTPGTYTVRLSAPQHITLLQPNVLVEVDGQIVELGQDRLLAGDVDNSGLVDLADATLIGANFNVEVPPAPFEPDLNGDGFVNIMDLVLVGGNLGVQSPITAE